MSEEPGDDGGLVAELRAKADFLRKVKMSVGGDYSDRIISTYDAAAEIAAIHEARWQADRATLEKRIEEMEAAYKTLRESVVFQLACKQSDIDLLSDVLKADRARWQVQTEQLLALTDKFEKAEKWYDARVLREILAASGDDGAAQDATTPTAEENAP